MPETSTDDGAPPPEGERLQQWLDFFGKETEVRFFRFEMNGPAWVVLCGLIALLLAIYVIPPRLVLEARVAKPTVTPVENAPAKQRGFEPRAASGVTAGETTRSDR